MKNRALRSIRPRSSHPARERGRAGFFRTNFDVSRAPGDAVVKNVWALQFGNAAITMEATFPPSLWLSLAQGGERKA